MCALLCAGAAEAETVGTVVLEDAHPPHTWRAVTPEEQKKFDLGYAAFNTEWSPANSPAGRTDGLGPLFNVQSCDACHNSRRRGRGPRASGDAPGDLVIQLGRLQPDGRVERGTAEYGRILNTNAVEGFTPEASVSITYADQVRRLSDGTEVRLRIPLYTVAKLTGAELLPDTVLMPRMPPPVMGAGLLERVPDSALVTSESNAQKPGGRFGWQATEPSIASQTASAFGREMGLTTQLNPQADCGTSDAKCLAAPNGGRPEVDDELFEAVVLFQQLHAVPVPVAPAPNSEGARIFRETGCAACHKADLPVEMPDHGTGTIHAYTDLLLHDMGEDLADRTLDNKRVHSEWRTAPLWGISASFASSQTLRLLHDGRARTIEEAVLWHGGAATAARERFIALDTAQRMTLLDWIRSL